jgi:proteasome activator subunit 4
METHGKRLRLSVDWRPLRTLVRAYLDGDSEGYNGAIPLAVHQAIVSRLARKSRRHFAPDAPAQIWAMLEPEIRAVDTADCFEGLGMLSILMPCSRIGDDDDTNPWDEWVATWIEMSSWMHTNAFWLSGWHALFAQLSKHDRRGRIDWAKHRAHMHTTALWFMEMPVGGGEGSCPFGRRSPSRATYVFNRFVNEDGMRVRTAAKALVYRLGTTNGGDGGDPDADAMDAIVDVAETYAHPSNNGRWHQNIALFVQHCVRYFRKRCASKRHVDDIPLSPEAKERFVRCMMRLIDPGMYSKNGKFRMASSVCAGQLAYTCPAAVLPKVMTRFQEAIEHSTATHQLSAALSVMTSCLRPMLLAPMDAFQCGTVPPPADYLAAVLDATLPGIDANDSHKTLGVVRLYASVVSNFGVLADPGEDGACESFPFFWSEWIPAVFDR